MSVATLPPVSPPMPAPPGSERATKTAATALERWLVLGLTGLGFGLRLYRLDAQSMWLDEAGRVEIARLGVGGVVQGVSVLELCPPLYHLLAALWIMAAGDSDFVIRLLSAMTGLLAVPLSWALARRLLGRGVPFDPATADGLPGAGLLGLGGALAAAVSPFYVFYAQEAAQYSLLLALALGHVYLLLRLLDGEDRRRGVWVALLAVTVAGLYTQYYFGFLLAGEGVYVFVWSLLGRRWRFLGWWAGAMFAAGAAFVPWLPYLRKQAQLAASNTGWGYPSPVDAAATVWSMNWLGFDTRLPAPLVLAACLPPLLLGLWVGRRQPARLALMASLVLVPFALAVGSAVVFHSFRERGFLIAAFVPYTLVAAALAWSVDRLRRGRLPAAAGALAAAAAVAVMGAALLNTYRYVEKENWRAAVAGVPATERPGDGAFFIHYGMQVPFDRYYRGGAPRHGLPFDFDWYDGYYKRNVFNPLDIPNSLGPEAAMYDRVWLVLSHDGARGSNVAISYLDRTMRRADVHEYLGVRVFLYERQPAARPGG